MGKDPYTLRCPQCGSSDLEQDVISEVFVRTWLDNKLGQMLVRLITHFKYLNESSEIRCLRCGYESEDYSEWVRR